MAKAPTTVQRLDKIESDINTIKTNHLHHIELDMSDIKSNLKDMDTKLWGLAILIVAAAIAGMFV